MTFDIGDDPRRWYTGLTAVTGAVGTAGVPMGKYDLFLCRMRPVDWRRDRSILSGWPMRGFGKGDGYNSLGATVTID